MTKAGEGTGSAETAGSESTTGASGLERRDPPFEPRVEHAAPERSHSTSAAVGTWKDAVIQIALITVGVIIALAFDGISTLWSQRALVREARANLTSEIQDNRKELQTVLMRMDGTDKQLQHGLGVVEALLAGQPVGGESSVGIGTRMAEFQEASRDTAEATGAFALMHYSDVKQYARVYSAQARFLRAQNEFFGHLLKTDAEAEALKGRVAPSREELLQLQRDLRLCLISTLALRQFAQGLAADYDRVLQAN